MKKARIASIAAACVFLIASLFLARKQEILPRIPLVGGGEFRVVKVTYTPRSSLDNAGHNIGSAPKALFLLRNALPAWIKDKVSEPNRGIGYSYSAKPAISVWWAWIDPATGKPELGPSGCAQMTLDSGQQIALPYPSPTNEGFRQIFFTDIPLNSRHLHFRVPVQDEVIEFTIPNPAFQK